MKLSIGLGAALVSFGAAAQHGAEVYILPSSPETASSTAISPSLARLILLQRLDTTGKGPSFRDVPDSVDPEEAVTLINKYGKGPLKLFAEKAHWSPSQLVVMLEGMTESQMKDMGSALGASPAFTIANPPSSAANEKLVKNDVYNIGVQNRACSIDKVINPLEESCWSGKSTIAKYDVSKDTKLIKTLTDNLSLLAKFAKSGEMETTLVLLPSSDATSPSQWADKPQELRRRQAEAVISAEPADETSDETSDETAPISAASSLPPFYTSTGTIPSCFSSKESCVTGTGNCSGRGECQNKWAKTDGAEGSEVCYTCRCLGTLSKEGGVTHWAGPACSKKDISVQFWLFAGFTLAMVSILYLAIGMLFSVGEEKLPGVIGAGVARSK